MSGMAKTRVENRLGESRKSRGVGASDLARRVHVSRQTIYAIELGTYVPNTEAALNLARELEVTVDDLFLLNAGPAKAPASIAAEVTSGSPARRGRPARVSPSGPRGVPLAWRSGSASTQRWNSPRTTTASSTIMTRMRRATEAAADPGGTARFIGLVRSTRLLEI